MFSSASWWMSTFLKYLIKKKSVCSLDSNRSNFEVAARKLVQFYQKHFWTCEYGISHVLPGWVMICDIVFSSYQTRPWQGRGTVAGKKVADLWIIAEKRMLLILSQVGMNRFYFSFHFLILSYIHSIHHRSHHKHIRLISRYRKRYRQAKSYYSSLGFLFNHFFFVVWLLGRFQWL